MVFSWCLLFCCSLCQCSATCGPGVKRREMQCSEKSISGKLMTFPHRRCRNLKQPNIELEEACNKGACLLHHLYNRVSGWYSSPWQQVRKDPKVTPQCSAAVSVFFQSCLFLNVNIRCFLLITCWSSIVHDWQHNPNTLVQTGWISLCCTQYKFLVCCCTMVGKGKLFPFP